MKDTLIIILAVIVGIGIGFVLFGREQPLGSIITGQEYYATSTDSGIGIKADTLIKSGYGSLSSIIVTSAGTTAYSIYNATSTDAVNNDSSFNKAANLLASIPASLVAGTYVFDVTYTSGLVLDMTVNGTASTTITFR